MIHSKQSQDTAIVLYELDDNHITALYDGKICTAVLNPFNGLYYVDDKFGVLEDTKLAKEVIHSDDPQFTVTVKQKTYQFHNGSEAFIFDAAILNDFYSAHSEQETMQYVSLTHDCYLASDVPLSLGTLSDFIATFWDDCKYMNQHEILSLYIKEKGE
jgi:hypothetical protein